MKCMYIRHTFGSITPLEPDEALVYSQERFPAISLYCAPINFGVWPRELGVNATLRLTNRRLILSGHVLLLLSYREEVDLWFPGSQPDEDTDLITSVSVGTGRYGPCLEIMSRNPLRRPSWHASPDLRARIFCEDPQELERVVNERISANQRLQPPPQS